MREVGYTSTSILHTVELNTPSSERDTFRISTWSVSSGLCFKCATHGIRCSSAGGYQIALHYCWIEDELPVFVYYALLDI